MDVLAREEQGRGLDVSSNQQKPAGGTERVGGVRDGPPLSSLSLH